MIFANLSIQRLLHKSIISQTDKMLDKKNCINFAVRKVYLFSFLMIHFSPFDKDFLQVRQDDNSRRSSWLHVTCTSYTSLSYS